MSSFADSYVGRLRSIVGSRPLLVSGVRVVIENPDGLLLFQLRGDFEGVWGLPGGNMEYGESASIAAIREVREETGLVLADLVPFGHSSDPALETVRFPNGDICHFQVMLFYSRNYAGSIRGDGHETLDLQWKSPLDMECTKTLPNMRATVDAFVRHRSTGEFQLM
jgi:8-oxo-dGTP pyrophosphatase MutT (NUDIX family)